MFQFQHQETQGPVGTYEEQIAKLKQALDTCDAVVIGAGAGLSTSAGFLYAGERFERYFFDFQEKYQIPDMYSGGFYPFPNLETYWAWWSRSIYINRYMDAPKPVYDDLLSLVRDKDYFVITTNVDHCFQKAGFDKQRLFYTQGDYGLFQSVKPTVQKTYDNEGIIKKMVLAQGFTIDENGDLLPPEDTLPSMSIPSELVPVCPDDGRWMTTNLRVDDTFVEDEGWHAAQQRYTEFLAAHQGQKVLYLELGVGRNTPVIIKYPFWRMTEQNQNAVYACLSRSSAEAPMKIADRSICINGDIGKTLTDLK